LLFCALAAATIASLITSIHLQRVWGSVMARHWEANIERGLSRFSQDHSVPVLADSAVPFNIVSYPFAPDNRLSRVLPLYANRIAVDGPLTGTLLAVSPTGQVYRAAVGRRIDYGSIPALRRAGRLSSTGAVEIRHGAICTGTSTVAITRVLPGTRFPGPYYLELLYTTATRGTLEIAEKAPPQPDPPGDPDPLGVSPNANRSLGWLPKETPQAITITIPALTSICLRALNFVTLRPAGRQ
jgi:hypothetical protein